MRHSYLLFFFLPSSLACSPFSVGSDVLSELDACIGVADAYQLAVLNQDLSTNFRSQTNEQRKFLRERYGGPKRKREADEGDEAPEGTPGGVKPAIALLVQFTRRKPRGQSASAVPAAAASASAAAGAETSASLDIDASVALPPLNLGALQSMDERESLDYVSPCGDWPMETIGTFALSLGAPCVLVPAAGATSVDLDRAEHYWRVRTTLLSLVSEPPAHLHCLVFDVKAVVCALLVHFRVPFLGAPDLPQLSDAMAAAWLLDPDDNRKTKLDAPVLMNSYCGSLIARQAGRKRPAEPGDQDIAVLMQDLADTPALLHALARRMQAERLLRPFVAQEMPLQAVLIDMQTRGQHGHAETEADAEANADADAT